MAVMLVQEASDAGHNGNLTYIRTETRPEVIVRRCPGGILAATHVRKPVLDQMPHFTTTAHTPQRR